jgi:hypothetical protein
VGEITSRVGDGVESAETRVNELAGGYQSYDFKDE